MKLIKKIGLSGDISPIRTQKEQLRPYIQIRLMSLM